ncbi:MAG: hypothetical protein PHZ11_07690 [Desulfitobacteriaceae bacterium]|nr:hypothetical protein [Desulfitobacteriaceae bacterium]MDD4346752.1 hypothetical protein [Desulfitobacteriaceae bacterium]MDD4401978.1 hypothetical protein [Desulfitobacteriaceae bacterium]
MNLGKQYVLYLFRWQLSSPILAGVLILMSNQNQWTATIVANLIGGLVFFWIDKYIFRNSIRFPLWEVQEDIKCVDCGQLTRGYRLVKTNNYDRTHDKSPEFRCERCSRNKLQRLKDEGIEI